MSQPERAVLQYNIQRIHMAEVLQPFVHRPAERDAQLTGQRLPGLIMKPGGIGDYAVQIEDHSLQLPVQQQAYRLLWLQQHRLAAVPDLQPAAFQQRINRRFAADADVEQLAAGGNLEAKALPLLRQCRIKAQHTVSLTQAAETVHNGHPGPGHCSHMQPVLGVAVNIIQIHPHRTVEVAVSPSQVADLSRNYTVYAGR
ncbi:hypothetical protein D3C75_537370 [compost metagenome]